MRKTEKTRGTRTRQFRKGASIQKVERKRGHPSSTCQRSPILCHISFYLVHKKKKLTTFSGRFAKLKDDGRITI